MFFCRIFLFRSYVTQICSVWGYWEMHSQAYTSIIFVRLSFALKGQCHEIFCFRFFHESPSPQAPENNIRVISNFFENSAEIFASPGAPTTPVLNLPPMSITPVAKLPAGINDTGGKFVTGIKDTGGKFCHQFRLCCWHRRQICHRSQRYRGVDTGGK